MAGCLAINPGNARLGTAIRVGHREDVAPLEALKIHRRDALNPLDRPDLISRYGDSISAAPSIRSVNLSGSEAHMAAWMILSLIRRRGAQRQATVAPKNQRAPRGQRRRR